MRDASKVTGRFIERGIELGERFMDDLEALAFNEAQQAGYQRVLRVRQRDLAIGLMAANDLDTSIELVQLTQKLAEPVDPVNRDDPTTAVLLAYEQEMAGLADRCIAQSLSTMREQNAATARFELDRRFAERLGGLLTADQREQLPKAEAFDIEAVLRELEGKDSG